MHCIVIQDRCSYENVRKVEYSSENSSQTNQFKQAPLAFSVFTGYLSEFPVNFDSSKFDFEDIVLSLSCSQNGYIRSVNRLDSPEVYCTISDSYEFHTLAHLSKSIQ